MKRAPLVAIGIGLVLLLAAFLADKSHKNDFNTAKEVIAMRNIAHQVLRYTGDSTSPIGPVNRLSASEFRISFGASFSFKPDSLVSIIDKVIASNSFPSKYIVNVVERKTNKVTYGYAVLGPNQQSIVPCMGREQPARPYDIDIKFEENSAAAVKGLYAGGGGMLGLGLVMFILNGYNKRRNVSTVIDSDISVNSHAGIAIGRYVFIPGEQLLKFNEEETILTVKESKILSIFASAPNQIIDRKRLQKEIWEDEGVIVSRSLDMFISRLRKKLENDPDIKLVNIHGKGYKLEINNNI